MANNGTRSQAEELLVAERAEKERLAALLHENGTPRFNAVCERAEKAEADNTVAYCIAILRAIALLRAKEASKL